MHTSALTLDSLYHERSAPSVHARLLITGFSNQYTTCPCRPSQVLFSSALWFCEITSFLIMSLPPGFGGNHNLSSLRSTKPENPKATLVQKWMELFNFAEVLRYLLSRHRHLTKGIAIFFNRKCIYLFIYLLAYLLTYLYIIQLNKIWMRIVLLSVGCWLEKRQDHMFCVWSQSPDLHVVSAKHIPGILQKMTVTAQSEVFLVNVSITSGLSSHHAAVRGKHSIPCVMWYVTLYTRSCKCNVLPLSMLFILLLLLLL